MASATAPTALRSEAFNGYLRLPSDRGASSAPRSWPIRASSRSLLAGNGVSSGEYQAFTAKS